MQTRAIECLAQVVESTGIGPHKEHALQLFSLALPALNQGYIDLRVAVFKAAASLTTEYGADVAPAVPYVLPAALDSLNSVDGVIQ